MAISSVLLSCAEGKKDHKEDHEHKSETEPTKYTCPMHPAIVQGDPGKCPICGMELIPKTGSSEEGRGLMLNETQVRLANITTQKVMPQSIGQTVVINGRLVVDQTFSEVISARASGRIEKLFFKETGIAVRKGDPLYELYSENLLTLQKEYLLAKDQFEALGKTEARYGSFLKASENKLLLYGLSKKQIEQLARTKAVQQGITFFAPTSGIITEISASEGQYLPEGGMLYRLENINRLWLEAELYPQETSLVKIGDKIKIQVNSYESSPIEGNVTFLSPEYRANTQITVLRASIENPSMKFKPGAQAQVIFSHSPRKTLAIPVDAVIRDGRGTHVYVETDSNTFQARMVRTGLEDFERVEITEGLSENEAVVVSGAYLLYSEMVLRNGGNPMAMHQHDAMRSDAETEMKKVQPASTLELSESVTSDPRFTEQLVMILAPYLRMKDAFVASNSQSAALESANFSKSLDKVNMKLLKGTAHINWMEKLRDMEQASIAIQNENNLEKQRASFSILTTALYGSFKMYSVNGINAYYQFCPMAFDNKGAYWISTDQEISNPYFGDKMLRCGVTKETIK